MDKYNRWHRWQERLHNLLKSGNEVAYVPPVGDIDVGENLADNAISLISYAACADPQLLLNETLTAASHNISMLALAALVANAPDQFLNRISTKEEIHEVLIHRDPDQLLEFIEYLKNRVFGKGFGSRPQKMVRRTMEHWSLQTLQRYASVYPKSLYALLRLVHPRYKNSKGQVVQKLLNSPIQ